MSDIWSPEFASQRNIDAMTQPVGEDPWPEAAASAALLAQRLQRQRLTVAVAESLTAGLVGATIATVPGASHWFHGGIISYSSDSKIDVLGVPSALLDRYGPVAPQTAEAMAVAVQGKFRAALGLATTGVAGPDAVGTIPPGVVYVAAVLGPDVKHVRRLELLGERRTIMAASVLAVLKTAFELLQDGE